ncbi:hypothetical protein EC844_1267 [Acinetobacter calcoaceticus]|uniref:Uncharacterized protein n=1 Tax=Acinetobacter calcoaceticus TaxID=471 RepID=A0A4R1XQE2_ACICA|nr:hypothetical protein EC844_1267 [Acinetobacter calcoaceticus]
MKRIDSINARPNLFGSDKKGFHANDDVPGQDATYMTPDWCNTVQEEIANVLERNGVNLDPNNRQQLYELLVTYPYIDDLMAAIENRFAHEAQLNKQARDELQAQITALMNHVVYPRIVASGVLYYAGDGHGGSVSWLGGSDGWDVSGDRVIAPSIYNLTDRNYGIFLSPESDNESYALERGLQDFKPKLWNRSGQNRVGYTGQVSFQVVQHKNPNSLTVDGDYPVGVYSFILQPNESKIFTLIGSGGGGGTSRHSSNSEYPLCDGRNGEDVLIKANGETIAAVHGGGGGTQGVWGNGSSYHNGAGGVTGEVEIIGVFGSTNITKGLAGNAGREDHSGGASVSPVGVFGKGGSGGDGVGDESWSFGGGGASGSVLVAQYTNNSAGNQTITLIVGSGGVGGTKGWSNSDMVGAKGNDGFARVTSA